ncbi:MAG TPA: TCR/Tet family MFS transporter [Thermoanaerobaculia bacterium]|nr:TCR/Tet family MFS transporter [Thermoanaerobaculia bacterium]
MSVRRAALGFVFVTVLLDMLALGLVVPVLPSLVTTFTGGDTARAAEAIGLYATVWALMQLVFSPVLGLLSDRFGRRPVILLSNFGLALDYLVMALAPGLGWLFVGRVLSGVTSASVPTAIAYMSDVTDPKDRARSFGFIGAAFGVGFVVGPALGGWLGVSNPRLPFWVAGAMSLANALWGIFVLPESLAKEKRRARLDLATANPLGALALLRRHRELFGLAAVNFIGWVAHEVYPVIFVLYAEYRYGWNERAVGSVLAGVGVVGIVVSAGLVGPAVKALGERKTLLLGTLLGAAGFAMYGWAPTGALFLLGLPVGGLWGLAGPASQALMSRRVSASEQGELQGALGSVRSLAMLVAPSIFSLTFARAIARERVPKIPGAPWFVAAVLLAAAAALAAAVTARDGEPRPL